MIRKVFSRLFSLLKYLYIYASIFLIIFIIGELVYTVHEYKKFKREGTKYNMFFKVPYLEHRLRIGYDRDYERGLVKINSLGFRGPEISITKPKGVFRIVCIGESTTFGVGCTCDKNTYPALLEQKLNGKINREDLRIEVINAGVPSYTSFQCYMLLGLEIIALKPDLIIIYTGWNDMGEGLRKGWNSDYRYGFKYQPFKEQEKSFFQVSIFKDFIEKSYFIKRWQKWGYRMRRSIGKTFHVSFADDKATLPECEKSQEVNEFAIEVWRNNVRNMIDLAKSNNIKVALFTWAQYLNDEKRYVLEKEGGTFSKKSIMLHTDFENRWLKSYKRYQQELGRIAQECNVLLFDAAGSYAGLDTRPLFYDEVHLTDKGNAILADGLSDFIIKNVDFSLSEGATDDSGK